nr:hypothetical protein [Tanacetum cinerariifolium]
QALGEEQHQPENIQELLRKLLNDLQILNGILLERGEHATQISTSYWKCPVFYDDDDEYTIQYREYLENSSNAIAPEEPDNSLSMEDEHLSTILETKSNEVIKSSVENLILIPTESEGIFDDTCYVPFCDNSPPLDVLNDHFELFSDFNDDFTSSDDDSFEDINYVEASPPDSELISLEEVKDDILHEKLLNMLALLFSEAGVIHVKDKQENDKIGTKPDKNGKRGKARQSDHCQPPQYTVNHPIFNVHNDFLHSQNKLMEQMTSLTSMCEMACQIIQKKQKEKKIEEEQAANARYWKIPACCDDDDDYNSAITPNEPVDSLSMGDEHLDTIPVTKSDEVIKPSVEDLVPIPSESEGIPNTMCDVHLVNNPTPLEAKDHFEIVINSSDDISSSDDDSLYNENIEYVEASPHDSELVSLEVVEIVIPEDEEIEDDNLHEKLLNVHLLIANIEALKDNPTPSFEFLTMSSSTSPKSFLEETNSFDNSLPEFENFSFDLEEISSASTTTHSDISLSDYEAFYIYDDHIEEISSGSTTTHSDISLSEYDSFIFDLSNDQFPPTDRSDFTHEEFADELAHIIPPLEYDCFYFRNLPDQGEWISILNSRIRENPSSTTRVNLPVEDDHSPLLAYVVWIFLAYLTHPVIPPYLHSFRNEDTIFDPRIAINHFYSFKSGLSHWCGTFKKFNTHRSHLNESPMEMLFFTCFLMDQ